MDYRVLTEAERKYTFSQSQQLSMQTGLIGYLRADFGSTGNEFWTTWNDFRKDLKTDELKAEFDDVINGLRDGDVLSGRKAMSSYCYSTPDSSFNDDRNHYGIGDLIRMDRYLNRKEKEKYPEWLEKQEERRAELAEQRKNREILSTAPPEPENKEDEPEAQYEYHLGDSVYIGASQYEILSFDENRVMLYDFDMPLFNKEISREEFDRKVRENPMNDHLKVSVLPSEEKSVTGENEAQNDTETVQDFSPKTGYDDAFFIDRDNESVTWMYYNPDSNAGGQYVTNTLSFDEIQQAAREYDSAEDFFDYLGSIANQELADVGTEWFVDVDREFHRTPDLTDCTSATMEALIENAERTDMVATNIGNVPIEDYREIVATQNGFDSYEEMYNEGVRIGNGYDKEPEPIVPAWEQKKKSKVKARGSRFILRFSCTNKEICYG